MNFQIYIQKEINVFYEFTKEDQEEIQEKEYTDSANEDPDYKIPVIKLDNEIPKITNKASFTISGTCENADYIVINGPFNFSGKMKLEDGRYSFTVGLWTGDNGGSQSEKGVYNFIQIYAANKDKVLVREYIVYYKE
ncbi:hypothetical protein [Candidatus Formimonas warabiya]|uniref:Uncharacterized protein n=1 Tax=Formimonas warabiya TaxID=1761012 RepID=A0A3G1KXX2_FORW1|nr:hypothetical protein [Candidatus Formimonas warabiya]ATW27334.1 hypothetical protein DCMF_23585 [Candidatus Formimonas warabiya]